MNLYQTLPQRTEWFCMDDKNNSALHSYGMVAMSTITTLSQWIMGLRMNSHLHPQYTCRIKTLFHISKWLCSSNFIHLTYFWWLNSFGIKKRPLGTFHFCPLNYFFNRRATASTSKTGKSPRVVHISVHKITFLKVC